MIAATSLSLNTLAERSALSIGIGGSRSPSRTRDLSAWFFGDPLPDMSALDRKTMNEPIKIES
jgi:hypothetical protein